MRDNHINVDVTQPTKLAGLIREEIERSGPMGFERFMDLALYAPGLGYYVRGRDPFGVGGDFYTAEQLQPVFGVLIAQLVASLQKRMGSPPEFRVIELGAGRGEMAGALAEYSYTPVEAGREFPARVKGVVFANEFLDALPVGVAVRHGGMFRDRLVTLGEHGFEFTDGGPCRGATLEYLERNAPDLEDGAVVEVHLRAVEWLDRVASALEGYLIVIDYGYTAREFPRHSGGTLMSYHRHTASPDVLSDPGGRDITAHVPFTIVQDRLERRGFTVERFSTLVSLLLDVGEADQFAAALRADSEQEALRRKMQLKTLLFGMGETFRVLVARSPREAAA